MNNNWQTKKLGEICEITTGSSNTIDAVDDGQYAFFDRSKTVKKSNHFLFNGEALIIPGEGAEFSPKYYLGKFNLHQRAYALLNFHKEVEIKFIEYYLIFEHKYFERVAVGATVKSLRRRHFMDLEIPLPPLSEQKRIVKILDEVFENVEKAKENAEKNLNNSKELYESYLYNIFANPKKDWEEKKLKEICDKLFAGGDVPKKNLSKTKTEKYNIPIYANGFKDKGLYGYTDIKKVTKPSITISARGTIGYAEVREEAFFPVVRLIVLTPNTTIDLYFLYYLTHSFKFSNTGTSIPQLTIPMVENIKIPVPSTSEQKRIVKRIDELLIQTKKLEGIYKQKLADLEELKRSILNKAFKGEL